MRQMAGTADERIVLFRRKPQRPRAERFPERLHFANGRCVGFFCRRHNANGVHKQIRARGAHAGFFRAGHRMAADEMRAGFL